MSAEKKSEPNSNALMSIEDLATLANASKTTLRRLVASGQLPAVKVGRLVRVRLADWHVYLEAHRMQVRPEPVSAPRPRAAGASAQPPRPQ